MATRLDEKESDPHAASLPERLPTFPAWAFSEMQRLRKAAGLGSLLLAAAAISFLEPQRWLSEWLDGDLQKLLDGKLAQRANLAFVQAAACMLLALLTPGARVLPNRVSDPARRGLALRACRRIQGCLMIVFSLWALYYEITGFKLLLGQADGSRPFLITLSTLTSLVLFWLYIEMGQLTSDSPVPPAEAAGSAALADRSTRTSGDIMPLRILGVGVAIPAVGIAWYGHLVHEPKILDAADTGVACLSGVGLCLVVGRLGSKGLDPGPITIALLYLYGVIQMGAGLFANRPDVHLAVTTIALPLKVLLWLVCVWAFTTGVLGEYVYEVRLLIERVEKERS